MPDEDTTLLTNATSIQGTLLGLDFEIVRRLYLLKDTKASEVPLEPTVELPKISVPTFDGDVLNWAVFWEQLETAIQQEITRCPEAGMLARRGRKRTNKKVISSMYAR